MYADWSLNRTRAYPVAQELYIYIGYHKLVRIGTNPQKTNPNPHYLYLYVTISILSVYPPPRHHHHSGPRDQVDPVLTRPTGEKIRWSEQFLQGKKSCNTTS